MGTSLKVPRKSNVKKDREGFFKLTSILEEGVRKSLSKKTSVKTEALDYRLEVV
jgi:hypothetical protein